MRDETRKKLRLFIKKVDQLSSFSFVDSSKRVGAKMMRANLPDERMGPDIESIHGFAVGLRFFIHDDDGISFRVLDRTVLDDPGLSDNWRQEFAKTRVKLNEYLDGPLDFAYRLSGGQCISRRNEVLQTFLYGDIIHYGERHDELGSHEKWESSSAFALLQYELVNILARLYQYAAYIAKLSRQELNASPDNRHDTQNA